MGEKNNQLNRENINETGTEALTRDPRLIGKHELWANSARKEQCQSTGSQGRGTS